MICELYVNKYLFFVVQALVIADLLCSTNEITLHTSAEHHN